uniref:Uncharacterized protein n=1 Tax=viral metagenome TaxID=1070528 RepID=A0A6C0KXW8_9ZZZZ
MNFEKIFLRYKNKIFLGLIAFLVITFLAIPNKVHFLYSTHLGRAYLIALLIILTKYNKYLGLASVFIIVMIYSSTDTITENFTEGEENKEDSEKKDNSIIGAIGAKFGLKKEDDKKESYENIPTTQASKIETENSIRSKSSKTLPTTNMGSTSSKQPLANWSGKEGYEGLGFAPV